MENDFLYLAKEQVEKHVESDKRMKCEDLLYNFNRYGMIVSFVSNFFTEVTDTEFNNEISELKMFGQMKR